MKNPIPKTILVACLLLATATASEARGFRGKHRPPPKTVYTAIASYNPTAMTLTTGPKNSTANWSKTYRMTPKTIVTIDGRPGTLADLKPGLRVSVGTGMDAGVAETVSVSQPPPDPK